MPPKKTFLQTLTRKQWIAVLVIVLGAILMLTDTITFADFLQLIGLFGLACILPIPGAFAIFLFLTACRPDNRSKIEENARNEVKITLQDRYEKVVAAVDTMSADDVQGVLASDAELNRLWQLYYHPDSSGRLQGR